MKKKSIIRFTTKMGMTARADIKAHGTFQELKQIAFDADKGDSYTYSIEHEKMVYHFSATSNKIFDQNGI